MTAPIADALEAANERIAELAQQLAVATENIAGLEDVVDKYYKRSGDIDP